MAALGTIRKRGIILICIIGLGLMAFIAEEFFRSCESTQNARRQQVGEVMGEKINVHDFQKLVDEYSNVIKMQQRVENLDEAQNNQVKDMVWQNLIQNKLIADQAEKLGLTVTEQEMVDLLNEGTNPLLMQTPFVNRQTGRFDVNQLKQFLANYKTQKNLNPQLSEQYETIYKMWSFFEQNLKNQLLYQKFQNLLGQSLLSNPVEAKMAFNDESTESDILLAGFPYTSIKDTDIKYSQDRIKEEYQKKKDLFRQLVESRDVKYISYQVKATAEDKKQLAKEFDTYMTQLKTGIDLAGVVRKSASLVPYLGIPVSKSGLPADIAARVDSMAVGTVSSVSENNEDNTLNIIKLNAKVQLPDSVEYRQIQVARASLEETAAAADSLYKALQAGGDFEALAKKQGQLGEKVWLTSEQYQHAPLMTEDTKNYISALNGMAVNEIRNVKMGQGNVILQVLNRKHMVTKYDVAVIKKMIDFSKDTYRAAYNKFSSFVSANQKVDQLLANAQKNGYQVQEAQNVTTGQHYFANIKGTRDAMKWIFDAKEKMISPMYECGDNDHLLVMVLNRVNAKGYRGAGDPQVADYLRAEVTKKLKAEKLMAKFDGVKSIADAKAKGAVIDTVKQVTFASPVFVTSAGVLEPVLSGVVSNTPLNTMCKKPVRGESGVYMFQVVGRKNSEQQFDAKSEEQKMRQKWMQFASGFMNDLMMKAEVKDKRYLFF